MIELSLLTVNELAAPFAMSLPAVSKHLKVLEDVGSQHWAVYTFVHDKWQVSPRMTVDLGVRWEYYDPIIGLAGKGSLSNYDPTTNFFDTSSVEGAIATVRDITRFREAEELKSTFISIMSHELKTPVALIKGYVSTLRRDDDSLLRVHTSLAEAFVHAAEATFALMCDTDTVQPTDRVDVEFTERIRGMVAFNGIAPLLAQMADDVQRARGILA